MILNRLSTLGCIILALLSASCSINHSLNTATYYGGELGVSDQHTVYRQKIFTIPANSDLLVANIVNHFDTPVGYPIAQHLERQLATNFARVHLTDKPQTLKALYKQAKVGRHDFLLTVELLNKSDQVSRDTDGKKRLFYDELYLNKTQLKLSLYDARTCRLLDLAYVNSRSGLLVTSGDYAELVKQSLAMYSNSLSGRQFVGLKDPVY